MDNVHSTSDASTLASAASFLSSLTNGNQSDSAEAKLFANFLAQNQVDIKDQAKTNNNATGSSDASGKVAGPNVSTATTTPTPVSTPTTLPSLKSLTSAWRSVLNKLQGQSQPKIKLTVAVPHLFVSKPIASTNAKAASKNANAGSDNTNNDSANSSSNNASPGDTASSNASSANPSMVTPPVPAPSTTTSSSAPDTDTTGVAVAPTPIPTLTPTLIAAPAPMIATVASSTDSVAATNSANSFSTDNIATTDGASSFIKDPKTIADLLAELQLLAQLIARQLQNAGNGQGTANAATAATATQQNTATDPTSGAMDPGLATLQAAALNNGGQALPSNADLLAALNSFSADLQNLGITTTGDTQTNAGDINIDVTDSASNTDNSATVAAPATTAQALTDLVSLAQIIAKQLDVQTNDNSTATQTQTANAAASMPGVFYTDPRLKVNAQNILNATASDAASNSVSDQDLTSPEAASLTFVATANDRVLASADNVIKTSTAASASSKTSSALRQDALFGSFNPAPKAGQTTSGAAPLLAAVPASSENSANNDSGFDLNKDAQGNGSFAASAHNAATETNSLSGLGSTSSSSSPYSFASQLAVTKATTVAASLSPAVEQVMLQLNRNVKSGNDQMTLQLNPAELGRVSIKLEITSDGKVQGTVMATNPATLDLLLKDVRGLERALQDAGLRADSGSLQFSLGGQGNTSGQPGNEFTKAGQSTLQNLAADTTAVTGDAAEIYYVTPGRVNLKV